MEEANSQDPSILAVVQIPAGTYGLTNNPLTVTLPRIILQGAGYATTVVDANPDASPLRLAVELTNTVTSAELTGLAIKNARNATDATVQGVGLKSQATNLALKDCEISNHTVAAGGGGTSITGIGFYHSGSGDFRMDNCLVSNNSTTVQPFGGAFGAGGYINAASLEIASSTISTNTLSLSGTAKGGGLVLEGPTKIEASNFSNNQAGHSGGALFFGSHDSTISHTTLSENRGGTNQFGTVIYAPLNKELSILHSTIKDSLSGGRELIYSNSGTLLIENSTISSVNGKLIQVDEAHAHIEASTLSSGNNAIDFFLSTGTLTLKSSIISSLGRACAVHTDPVQSLGYNVVIDGFNTNSSSCNTLGKPLDIVGADPLLNALGANGGPTQTMSLQAGSPALSIVPLSECLPVDQTGHPRTGGAFCDAGSYQSR